MSEFEEQLKQEELARQQSSTVNDREYTDADGTVFEWDDQKNAWFPKIDADFIAKYQMNYGVDQSKDKSESEKSESKDQSAKSESTDQPEYNKEEYDKYWKDYYNYYYYGQQSDQDSSQKQSGDGANSKTDESNENGKDGHSTTQTTQNDETYDPSDHYSHYFSQYYDENYAAYPNEDETNTAKDEDESNVKSEESKEKKKEGKVGEKRKPQAAAGWVEIEDDKNTNVYVSGLPLDITDEEFNQFMTKCGLIMPDLITKEPKIKLYRDANKEPKGDGRCCYLKVASVNLALQILDGGDLRGHTVHVERAKFTMKGSFDPKKKRKKLNAKEKKKLVLEKQKMLDWKPEIDDTRMRWEKVVVLKHMFDPKDFEEDPLLINELREDVREESSKHGEVKKVMLYDRHPEGVMTVHFKEFESSDTCVTALNGRWFAKKQISAEIWDGKTKYEIEESTAERDERLKKWENFLETDEKKSEQKSDNLSDDVDATNRPSVVVVNTDIATTTESSASEMSDAIPKEVDVNSINQEPSSCNTELAGVSEAK